MHRFPILKGVSGDQKVAKVLGVGLDKRQIIVLVGALFAFWLLYKQLSRLLPMTTAQAFVAFAPLALLAIVVAFVTHDGRHVDWWVLKKTENRMKPRILKWIKKHPGGRNKKPLRESIQEALPSERILWEMLRTDDGRYLIAFEARPVSLSLAGDTERERIWAAMAQLYNRIDFPIIEMTRSREGNVKSYTRSLRDHVKRHVSDEEGELAAYARGHLDFLEDLVRVYNVYERRGYIILPYTPSARERSGARTRPARSRRATKKKHRSRKDASASGGLLRSLGLKPSVKDAEFDQDEAEHAYRVLASRAETVIGAFAPSGVQLRLLSGLELQDFVADQTSGEDERTTPSAFEPVTLRHGAYATLPPRRLNRRLAAAEKVRKKTRKRGGTPAPPAPGMGDLTLTDLTLSDKIAPDAVRVHADYLRVGNRYHATLFVYEWMPDVGFGDLQGLMNIPGRVKIVKYIDPLPQDKAVQAIAAKAAELEAAHYTASDGDVRARRQRQIAYESADAAQTQLQTGQQGMLDLSFLVHCEAGSRDDLDALVESVRTKLAAIRVSAKLAREESWQGYVSTLPFGKNYLTHRYANKPMLTYPLACLFVHGSFQLHHEDGILMGVDPYSGSTVVLDSRELPNPHMVVVGQPGGGKTVAAKAMSTRLRMRGHRVVIIDPEGNSGYGRVARSLGGQYVVFGIGSRHCFNPCDLTDNYLNLSLLASAVEDEERDPEEARRMARAQALKGKIRMLTRLVSLMLTSDDGTGGLTASEQSLVERVWHEVYAERGITDDPDTHALTPPTMPDFFRRIREVPSLRDASDRLYSWEHGALRDVFGSQTNVDMANKYLVLQIAGVEGSEKAAIMYALLDFLNGQLSDPTEPSDCFVDEFWSLLKYPMAAEFAEVMFRSGRARNNAMVALTQEISEFLASEQGKVIMRISASQLLLKQNKKTAEILDEFIDLSEEQKRDIISFEKGAGYLVVENNQVPLYVAISPEEDRLFNTDPKREAAFERAELEAAAGVLRGESPEGAPSDGTPNGVAGGAHGGARRRLSARGLAKEFFSEDDVYVPEADDLEPVAEPAAEAAAAVSAPGGSGGDPAGAGPAPERPRGGPAQENAPRPDGEESALPLPPFHGVELPGATEAGSRIHAVVGGEAPVVAWNLAGLMAWAGKEAGRKVLFVDAEGGPTRRHFDPLGIERPDALIVPEGAPTEGADLGGVLPNDPHSTLTVLVCPQSTDLPAHRLIEAARRTFDAVIVACGPSPYARDWLTSADGVVIGAASGADPGSLLEDVEQAEAARGENGTLIAPMGPLAPSAASSVLGGHRRVFELPAKDTDAFAAAHADGSFAWLHDYDVGYAFKPLLLELAGRPAPETVDTRQPAHPVGVGAASARADHDPTEAEREV